VSAGGWQCGEEIREKRRGRESAGERLTRADVRSGLVDGCSNALPFTIPAAFLAIIAVLITGAV
jgi:hypothetical protein